MSDKNNFDFRRNISKVKLMTNSNIGLEANQLRYMFINNRSEFEKIFNEVIKPDLLENNVKILTIKLLFYAIAEKDEKAINDLYSFYSENKGIIFQNIQYNAIIELIMYADFLAENEFIDQSMAIIRDVRIINLVDNEVDRSLQVKLESHITNGETDIAVETINGWIDFVLVKCAVPGGRKYLDEIIDIVSETSRSINLYIKYSSLWPLSQLAYNRLTINPSNHNQLFLDDDKVKALNKAKRIEKLIFLVADEISNKDNNIKKTFAHPLAYCLNMIRALDKSEAESLLEIIKSNETELEALKEYVPIIVYFAFIREFAFKNWEYTAESLYDNLSSFKETTAEKYFEYLKRILNKKIEIKQMISYQIFAIFKADAENKLKDDIKDLDSFKNNLQNKAFELFEELLTVYDETIFSYVFDSMMFNINKNLKHDKGYAIIKKYFEVELVALINAPHPLYYYYKEPGDEIFMPIYNLSKEKFKEILKIFMLYHEGGKYYNRKMNLYKTYEKVKELSSGDKEFEEIRKAFEKYYSYLK